MVGSRYYQKSTPGTHGGVSRSQEVPPRLGGGPREEHGPVGEDWGYNGVEMEFVRKGQEEGERR